MSLIEYIKNTNKYLTIIPPKYTLKYEREVYIKKKQRELSLGGKMTLYFRGVERGKDLNVSSSSEAINMMEQYFSELLFTGSNFLTIDELQVDQFSYDIKDVEQYIPTLNKKELRKMNLIQ